MADKTLFLYLGEHNFPLTFLQGLHEKKTFQYISAKTKPLHFKLFAQVGAKSFNPY